MMKKNQLIRILLLVLIVPFAITMQSQNLTVNDAYYYDSGNCTGCKPELARAIPGGTFFAPPISRDTLIGSKDSCGANFALQPKFIIEVKAVPLSTSEDCTEDEVDPPPPCSDRNCYANYKIIISVTEEGLGYMPGLHPGYVPECVIAGSIGNATMISKACESKDSNVKSYRKRKELCFAQLKIPILVENLKS